MKKRLEGSLRVAGLMLVMIASACARTSSTPVTQTAVKPSAVPGISREPVSMEEAMKLPPVNQPAAHALSMDAVPVTHNVAGFSQCQR